MTRFFIYYDIVRTLNKGSFLLTKKNGDSMARDFAKKFYASTNWIHTRDSVIAECFGICERCHIRPAEIVHHIIWLNASNINDPSISLSRDNLLAVCRECHAEIHLGTSSTTEETMFDDEGNLIRR